MISSCYFPFSSDAMGYISFVTYSRYRSFSVRLKIVTEASIDLLIIARSEKQGRDLGPLQKQILLHLATKGPKNINKTAKEMSAHYKSVHTAFYSLEKKGMIMRAGKVSYRGRSYDFFGLRKMEYQRLW